MNPLRPIIKYLIAKQNKYLHDDIFILRNNFIKLKDKLYRIRKLRRQEKSKIDLKWANIRKMEYSLITKEIRLNELILQKEDQVNKAKHAEKIFQESLTELNIYFKMKNLPAQNIVKDIGRGN